MKKKFISALLATIVLVSMFTIPVSAQENTQDQFQARYIACPDGGKHQMRSSGRGVVYDTDEGSNKVNVYKCGGCGLYLGCQFSPYGDKALGGYATSYSPDNAGGSFQFYGGFEGAYYNLVEDSFIQGFQWL